MAVKSKLSSKQAVQEGHWLDYAHGHYEPTFIEDIKKTLRIFVLFAPLPVFWSLLDQLGSRWTLQAARMDGGFSFYTVKPDQVQVLCPILILFIIPVFKKIIYPFLGKYGLLLNPLHKLITGCILAAIAYICTGMLEMKLEKTYPVLPSEGFGQMRIFNGRSCELRFQRDCGSFVIQPLGIYEDKFVVANGSGTSLSYQRNGCVDDSSNDTLLIRGGTATSFFYGRTLHEYQDSNRKSRSGFPYIRFLTNTPDESQINITLYNINKKHVEFSTNSTFTEQIEVFSDSYKLYVNSNEILSNIHLKIGGVYTMVIDASGDVINASAVVVTEPNSVSVLWIIPQIFIISTAEVLFAIPGLEFAFKEAPESMKSVLQAYWLMVEAFGNLIIIVVTRLGAGYRQVHQFFFYAALMLFSTAIFFFMTRRYDNQVRKQSMKPVNEDEAKCEFINNNMAN